jgi:hypothetical protein
MVFSQHLRGAEKGSYMRCILGLLILLIVLGASFPSVSATPTLTVGHSWTYSGRVLFTNQIVNITEIRNVTAVQQNPDGSKSITITIHATDNPNSTITEIRQEDLSLVSRTLQGNDGRIRRYTYLPPFKQYVFPLEVGATWTTSFDMKIESIEQNQRLNRTGFMHQTFQVKVQGREDVQTFSGPISSYVLDYYYIVGNVSQRWYRYYYSDAIAGDVREVTYTPSGQTFRELNITAYSVAIPEYDRPQVITVVVIVATSLIIAVGAILVRRRRSRVSQSQ